MRSIEEELGAPAELKEREGRGIDEGGGEAMEESDGASRKWWKSWL